MGALAGLLFTSSGFGQGTDVSCVAEYSSQVLSYFREVALTPEGGDPFATPRRWQDDIRVGFSPETTVSDRLWVEQAANTLRPMVSPVKLEIVEESPNIVIRSVPISEFRRYVPEYRGHDRGLFWIDWDEHGAIREGGVLIAVEIRDSDLRRHILLEELTQALGLPGDSGRYPDSLFFRGESRVTGLSDLDQSILRLLYDPGISDQQRLFGSECP